MIENNVVINFTSRRNILELGGLMPAVLRVMWLRLLNRNVMKLKVMPQANQYQLIIHVTVTETETEERATREVFKRFEFGVAWSDFDNLGDEE